MIAKKTKSAIQQNQKKCRQTIERGLMRIDVRSEVVRNNLELLKTLVRKSQSKETQAFVEMSTGCLIKLNPETRSEELESDMDYLGW